jgi:hypothetical protein
MLNHTPLEQSVLAVCAQRRHSAARRRKSSLFISHPRSHLRIYAANVNESEKPDALDAFGLPHGFAHA